MHNLALMCRTAIIVAAQLAISSLVTIVCVFLDDVPDIFGNIVRLKFALTNIVEPDFGLLDELMRLEVLTRPELADVRSERTVYRRNAAFLDLLTTSDQCDKLLKALERTQQPHIVNCIRENGGQKNNDIIPKDI